MNFESTCINSEHKDLIHDVAFDHYGRRMATCSSDQFVKVWDKNEVSNKWKQTAEWKAHSGSVWKVAWAHPEFGQVLATCSFDRTAAVWEEIVGEGYGIIGQKHWARRTNLVDSRTSVMDVKFAPKTLGLLLATCSTDGMIRIYEAPDVMNLAQWTLQQEIMACKCQASCISWNPSYTREWRYTKYSKISNEKKDGEEYNQEGASTSSGSSTNNSSQNKEVETYVVIPQVPMLAVGSDDTSSASSRVVVLQYFSKHRRWHKIDPSPVISDPVHDLAFAPRLGRSYDLLAIATKGIKIFILSQVVVKQKGHSAMKYEISQLTDCFDDHHSIVWRVSWNSVGSILASSDDDGRLRLWKQDIKVIRQGRGLQSWRPKEVAGIYPGKPGPSSAEDTETDKIKIENTLSHVQEKEVSWKCVSVIGGDGRVVTPVFG